MITDLRDTRFFVGTRYSRMNVYIRSQQKESEVELRYLGVTSWPFWSTLNSPSRV